MFLLIIFKLMLNNINKVLVYCEVEFFKCEKTNKINFIKSSRLKSKASGNTELY